MSFAKLQLINLQQFTISPPFTGTTVAAGAAPAGGQGQAIGDCVTDSFSIRSPGNPGSPVICGINTGYHSKIPNKICARYIDSHCTLTYFLVILDVSGGECQTASFAFTENGNNRNWEIKVLQYNCRNDDIAGPPGCLQYYRDTMGTIQSFNYPPNDMKTDMVGNTGKFS